MRHTSNSSREQFSRPSMFLYLAGERCFDYYTFSIVVHRATYYTATFDLSPYIA